MILRYAAFFCLALTAYAAPVKRAKDAPAEIHLLVPGSEVKGLPP
jgi:hypothetical protein